MPKIVVRQQNVSLEDTISRADYDRCPVPVLTKLTTLCSLLLVLSDFIENLQEGKKQVI